MSGVIHKTERHLRVDAPIKVLIVDDLEDVRWALSNVVRLEGFVPLTAASGEEALVHFLREKPDVVLL
ncbi:MAG: hypothetical protein WC216_11320, partial [Gallionella sp.]